MKPVYAALLLLVSDPSTDPEELRVSYRTDQVVTFEQSDWASLTPSGFSVSINGEELPEESLEEMDSGLEAERTDDRVRMTTWLETVEDGRPIRGLRRFDALTRTKVEGEEKTEQEGVIVGRTLLLSGSVDSDEVEAQPAPDDAEPSIEDLYLAGHELAYEGERYFPARPVDVGDTWELEDEAVREILGLDSDAPTYFEPDEDEEVDDPFEEAMNSAAELSGDVVYERREEVEGVECAVLVITLHVKVDGVDVDPAQLDIEEEEGVDVSAKITIEISGEERLWFAIEEGRPMRSEAEYEGSTRLVMTMSNAEAGMEMDMELAMDLEGAFEGTWSYEDR